MKKQIFSKGLYAQALLRLKTFTIILTVISIIATISPFIEYLYWTITGYIANLGQNYSVVSSFQLISPTLLIVTVCAFVMPLIVFCQFNSRRYGDFYLSLPYTRKCIFVSFTAAIFTMLLGMLITVLGLEFILYSSFSNYFILNLSGFGIRLLTAISAMLFICAVSALASSITHKAFAAFVTGLVIGVAPRLIIGAIQLTTNLTTSIMTILPLSSIFSSSLNSVVYIFTCNLTAKLSIIPAIYTTVIAVVYFIFAGYFFKIKKSEDNAQPTHNKLMQAIIRILLGVIFTLVPTMFIVASCRAFCEDLGLVIVGTIPCYLFAAVFYFAYELIVTKKWKRLLYAIPGFAIVIGINILCALCVVGCSNIALTYTPSAEQIDSVKIVQDSEDLGESLVSNVIGIDDYLYTETNCFENAANAMEITSPEVKTLVAATLKENIKAINGEGEDAIYYQKSLTFAIKDGAITRYRTISFTSNQYKAFIAALSESESYKKAYTTVPDCIEGTLASTDCSNWKPTEEETEEVLALLQSEINELGFDKWYESLNRYDDANVGKFGAAHSFSISYIAKQGNNEKVYVKIYSDTTPKTFEYLLEKFYGSSVDDVLAMAEAILTMSDENDGSYKYCDIAVELHNLDIEDYTYGDFYYYSDSEGENGNTLELCKSAAMEIIKLIESLEDEKPTCDRYISVNISYEDYSNILSMYSATTCNGMKYLPLPEDYDISALVELIKETNTIVYDEEENITEETLPAEEM